ncbi:MAG: ribose-5-phosphate isomerase RpiA [Myxococcota bacterium]|nr:ribose-5-phosphate isomerase RpiA [Myxococcota bacterium]
MSEGPEGSAQAALEFVKDGQTLGLGTGRAAAAFVRALGERVQQGLSVRGVPTSEATAALAREVGIPLLTLAEAKRLDTTFDGADEVDPALDVIKGYGGALVREKIVAASSQQLVILVGAEKLVGTLGERGKLPVEVLDFGRALCTRRLAVLGCEAVVRTGDDRRVFRTDNGNPILDCKVSGIADPAGLEAEILAIPGVLGTGLFVGMADAVIVQDGDAVEVKRR